MRLAAAGEAVFRSGRGCSGRRRAVGSPASRCHRRRSGQTVDYRWQAPTPSAVWCRRPTARAWRKRLRAGAPSPPKPPPLDPATRRFVRRRERDRSERAVALAVIGVIGSSPCSRSLPRSIPIWTRTSYAPRPWELLFGTSGPRPARVGRDSAVARCLDPDTMNAARSEVRHPRNFRLALRTTAPDQALPALAIVAEPLHHGYPGHSDGTAAHRRGLILR